MTETIRRRRCHTSPALSERPQQGLRNRMGRASQTNRILPAGDIRRNMGCTLQNQRQRPRPENVYQLHGLIRNMACPITDIRFRRDMHDKRMIRRTVFHCINRRNGRRIFRIPTQSVNSFCRKGNQPPGFQNPGGCQNIVRIFHHASRQSADVTLHCIFPSFSGRHLPANEEPGPSCPTAVFPTSL